MSKNKKMSESQKTVRLNAVSSVKKRSFFSEFKTELKKVTWTSKDELLVCGRIVIASILSLGIAIYVLDIGCKSVLALISKIIIHLGA